MATDLLNSLFNRLGYIVTEAKNLPERSVQLLRRHIHRVIRCRADIADVIHFTGQILSISTGKLEEQVSNTVDTAICWGILCVLDLLLQVGNRRRGNVVGGLSEQRMDEVGTTECACHQGRYLLSIRTPDCDVLADVAVDLIVSKFAECQLAVIAVSRKILQSMQSWWSMECSQRQYYCGTRLQTCSEKTQGFV